MHDTDTDTDTEKTSGTNYIKRHILVRARKEDPQPERALCGHLWDRINVINGDLCDKCVEIFKKFWPNIKLPT